MPSNADLNEAATHTQEDFITLMKERDEADRRAGAAERKLAHLEEEKRAYDQWLRNAKEQRGYHENVSFDQVWAETCAKADCILAEAVEVVRDCLLLFRQLPRDAFCNGVTTPSGDMDEGDRIAGDMRDRAHAFLAEHAPHAINQSD